MYEASLHSGAWCKQGTATPPAYRVPRRVAAWTNNHQHTPKSYANKYDHSIGDGHIISVSQYDSKSEQSSSLTQQQ